MEAKGKGTGEASATYDGLVHERREQQRSYRAGRFRIERRDNGAASERRKRDRCEDRVAPGQTGVVGPGTGTGERTYAKIRLGRAKFCFGNEGGKSGMEAGSECVARISVSLGCRWRISTPRLRRCRVGQRGSDVREGGRKVRARTRRSFPFLFSSRAGSPSSMP